MLTWPTAESSAIGIGQDHSPLLHPLLALGRVLFHPALQGRDDRDQKLQDNLGSDVRIHTHRQDREVGDRTAREQIQQVNNCRPLPRHWRAGPETAWLMPGTGMFAARR